MPRSIEILLFAAMKEAAMSDSLTVPVGDQTTAGDVLESIANQLSDLAPIVRISRLAVNGKYVSSDFKLANTNVGETEFALIPPVSGG